MRRKLLLIGAPLALWVIGGAPLTAQFRYSAQGFDEHRRDWYAATQGSRLIPEQWLRRLERAEDRQPFLDAVNIGRFRYLVDQNPAGNGLPVGFAIDAQNDSNLVRTRLRWLPGQSNSQPWVGFNCAACHTGEIARGAARVRIDGAPGLGDYQAFNEALVQAMRTTRATTDKWDRFASGVLGSANQGPQREQNRARLAKAVDQWIEYRTIVERMNEVSIRYGFARVDAFGHIFNQASLFSNAAHATRNPSTAPVSYPFLWNVPQHDRVQWNGSVANTRVQIGPTFVDFGAIGRNAGEVIGVYGEVSARAPTRLLTPFVSSVRMRSLMALERYLEDLLPPAWPEDVLGPIDRAAADRGRPIFIRACRECHADLLRTELRRPIVADMSWFAADAPPRPDGQPNRPPGTDPIMACNAFMYRAASGVLRGYKSGDKPIGDTAAVRDLLTVEVTHAMEAQWSGIAGQALKIYLGGDPRPEVDSGLRLEGAWIDRFVSMLRPPGSPATGFVDSYPGLPDQYRACVNRGWVAGERSILGYKARPLSGIWATAPYLHNGSVPSLYELLLPPSERTQSFFLGTRQFDPGRVGFVTTRSAENSFEFETRDDSGDVIWGNFNGGHDYDNAALTPQMRLDLLEYLKTL